jgi:hypothetical protein
MAETADMPSIPEQTSIGSPAELVASTIVWAGLAVLSIGCGTWVTFSMFGVPRINTGEETPDVSLERFLLPFPLSA